VQQTHLRKLAESLRVVGVGLGLSILCWAVGSWLSRKVPRNTPLDIQQGVWSVVLTWIIAITISATVFVLAGFPDPARIAEFPLYRRFVDGVFESISGFTTAGGSILPSVEVFPRGILMWRSLTHWLGGMGIAFFALTILRSFRWKRETVINAEAEGPNYVKFLSEDDARTAGIDFLKIFGLLTVVLAGLLFVSGAMYRNTPYLHWYDNAFDAINHSVSVMGTGGFGVYDASVGLQVLENGRLVNGGLRDHASEWIIALFMWIAGSNLSLWYVLFFKGKTKQFWQSREFRTYFYFVLLVTGGIWTNLVLSHTYESWHDALRVAFFNVNTILSTTGLANTDFTAWPAAAEALLFCCYLVGGMVGSTAGGLKMLRFNLLYKYLQLKLQNFLFGRYKTRTSFDGTRYDMSALGLVAVTIVLYFGAFMLGAMLIMITSPQNSLPDGTIKAIDFISAIGASIANLGNIGPAVEIGNLNAGPTGNYFPYSVPAKLVMSGLMMIGRVGVLTVLTIFISRRGIKASSEQITQQKFDSDAPILRV
jgi:trk system potassium uptake protein TrkH